ncbi:hypothetical protein SKAU_G00174160 [Synaphobranchus kaupii]|uniref:Phosphatidate cytidylyltransferase n=1 Tax=Synaphobranchus kaupii TaxID=118154 RepID=A0A9Q1FL43_SYNKA|nr:hypothetical protein SKAU_G00174160 [Synaphobranchus kaupii]
MSKQVLCVQIKCFQEIITIGYSVYHSYHLPWFRTLSWYFLLCVNYFFYGETVTDYFFTLVQREEPLRILSKYHRFISFALYLTGFCMFVLSLVKKHYRLQFYMFGWTHVTLLIVVTQSHLIIHNLFEGMIWFIVPISCVICNDIMAYMFGFFFGRTPLIKLSPKKTWEGFIGGFFATVLFGILLSYVMAGYRFFVCPVEFNNDSNSFTVDCEPPELFQLQEYGLPSVLESITGWTTVRIYPFQIHSIALSAFASIMGPFGGFFASGFKRAFKIKDFANTIPGHGGIMDRFDCQYLMATFVNVYIASFIRGPNPSKVIQQLLALRLDQQLHIFNSLKAHLTEKGLLSANENSQSYGHEDAGLLQAPFVHWFIMRRMSLKLPRNWDFSTFRAETNKMARSKSVMPGEVGAGACRPGSPKSAERPLKTGWLKKQRSIVKNWQLRYFVLKGYTLYYYKDDKDNAFQRHINLRSSQVNELPSNADDPGKFLFEIIPGSSGERERDPYVLMANSQNEMEEWVRTLRRVIGVPSSGAVFGKSLGDTVMYEQRFGPHLVPILVLKCSEFIREHGLSEEGIFRLPGQDNQVKQFRDAFDAGERPSFPSDTDVHTVASLFKLYLRELPEPVIPWAQYQDFLDCSHLLNPNGTMGRDKLEKQISLLPRANYNLLSYICRFLYEVQQNSKVNKMSVENLATVIGVNLLKPKIEDPVTMMKGTTQIQKLMTVMIRQHESLFPSSKDVPPSPPSKKSHRKKPSIPRSFVGWDAAESETLSESPEEDGPEMLEGEAGDGEGSEGTTLAQPSCPSSSSSSSSSLTADPWTGSPRKRTQTLPTLAVRDGRPAGPHKCSLQGPTASSPLPALDADGEMVTLSEDIFKILDLQQDPLFTGPRGGHNVRGRGRGRDVDMATASQPDPPKPSGIPPQPQTQPPQEESTERERARGVVSASIPGAKAAPQNNAQESPQSHISSLQQRNGELVARVTELESALDAEKRLVAALEIRLRNAELSRDEAQRRNQELDKEIPLRRKAVASEPLKHGHPAALQDQGWGPQQTLRLSGIRVGDPSRPCGSPGSGFGTPINPAAFQDQGWGPQQTLWLSRTRVWDPNKPCGSPGPGALDIVCRRYRRPDVKNSSDGRRNPSPSEDKSAHPAESGPQAQGSPILSPEEPHLAPGYGHGGLQDPSLVEQDGDLDMQNLLESLRGQFLRTFNLSGLGPPVQPDGGPRAEPPEYMIELYNRFANDHTAMPSANIVRSFKNEAPPPTREQLPIATPTGHRPYSDLAGLGIKPLILRAQPHRQSLRLSPLHHHDSSPDSVGSGGVRRHPLLFNVSIPHHERVTSAELRLYTLVQRDRHIYAGVDRRVTVFEVQGGRSDGNEDDNRRTREGEGGKEEGGGGGGGGGEAKLLELASRQVYGTDNGWESFDLTAAVHRWRKLEYGTTHRLEVHIASLTGEGEEPEAEGKAGGGALGGNMEIDVSPEAKHKPLMIVFSDDQSSDHRGDKREINEMIGHESTGAGLGLNELWGDGEGRGKQDGEEEEEDEEALIQMRSNLIYDTASRIRRNAKGNQCKKTSLYVEFKDIGWDTWILAPTGYEAFECNGVCTFPLTKHVTPTKHAIIQTLVSMKSPQRVSQACCVPTKLDPISLLYMDETGVVTYKYKYDGMVCRRNDSDFLPDPFGNAPLRSGDKEVLRLRNMHTVRPGPDAIPEKGWRGEGREQGSPNMDLEVIHAMSPCVQLLVTVGSYSRGQKF